jgi:hypothetical protein
MHEFNRLDRAVWPRLCVEKWKSEIRAGAGFYGLCSFNMDGSQLLAIKGILRLFAGTDGSVRNDLNSAWSHDDGDFCVCVVLLNFMYTNVVGLNS